MYKKINSDLIFEYVKKSAVLFFIFGISYAITLPEREGELGFELYMFIKNTLIKNITWIAAFCGLILSIVAAIGQDISKHFLNNIAFICYAIFGSSLVISLIKAQGLLL